MERKRIWSRIGEGEEKYIKLVIDDIQGYSKIPNKPNHP
jgi:hypothetical protein